MNLEKSFAHNMYCAKDIPSGRNISVKAFAPEYNIRAAVPKGDAPKDGFFSTKKELETKKVLFYNI